VLLTHENDFCCIPQALALGTSRQLHVAEAVADGMFPPRPFYAEPERWPEEEAKTPDEPERAELYMQTVPAVFRRKVSDAVPVSWLLLHVQRRLEVRGLCSQMPPTIFGGHASCLIYGR
jgi:hypothetical protein